MWISSTRQNHLKTHQQYQHKVVKCSCNKCEYQATTQRFLKIHQQSKHESVKYSCTQWQRIPWNFKILYELIINILYNFSTIHTLLNPNPDPLSPPPPPTNQQINSQIFTKQQTAQPKPYILIRFRMSSS